MALLNLVIFGITSNLAQLKLIPALYDLAKNNILPENIRIIGIARSPKTPQEVKSYIHEVLHSKNRHHEHPVDREVFNFLVDRIFYLPGHIEDQKFYLTLKNFLTTSSSSEQNIIFYFATYPNLYQQILENLQKVGLNKQQQGWVRLMIEKPIGHDLQSAKELNQLLLKYFSEEQIYRLDHYLGKETLQNLLVFRFANNVFEHLINKDYIDHIQVTALEDFGIGNRGAYYDSVGALRDVGQNHILQMIAFATMEQPETFSNEAITKERLKILQNLIPMPDKIVFGQYQGYRREPHVAPNSQTDTFFAFKTEINNSRFKGVPIYVRAGKKLTLTITEIAIVFKPLPKNLFGSFNLPSPTNTLIYRIQPNEGIVLTILSKKPGYEHQVESSYMQFCYKYLADQLPDPYERLIADCIKGDQTFFNDAAEVEAQWAFIDPLFAKRKHPEEYQPGSFGPESAQQLIEADGRKWLEPSMLFCSF